MIAPVTVGYTTLLATASALEYYGIDGTPCCRMLGKASLSVESIANIFGLPANLREKMIGSRDHVGCWMHTR